MNIGNLTQWIFGLIMIAGSVLMIDEMRRNGWRIVWEETFGNYLEMRSEFESKIYKYQDDMTEISSDYVVELTKLLNRRRKIDKQIVGNINLTDYLLHRSGS